MARDTTVQQPAQDNEKKEVKVETNDIGGDKNAPITGFETSTSTGKNEKSPAEYEPKK